MENDHKTVEEGLEEDVTRRPKIELESGLGSADAPPQPNETAQISLKEEDSIAVKSEKPTPQSKFDLSDIKTTSLTEPGISILNIIENALNSTSPGSASIAAQGLDLLCPSTKSTEVGDYIWVLWTMLLEVAQALPPDSDKPGQGTLVAILFELQQCAKGDVSLWGSEWRLWRDLPLLSNFMDETWTDPVRNDEILEQESARMWRNQNAFAARCVGAGVGEWAHFGIWQLRAALEEDRAAEQSENRECLIQVASEWVIHSGPRLLQWAEDEDKEPFDWGTDVAAGSLFQGSPGLSLRRWKFWKDRFNEVSKDTALCNEGARVAAREAVESMVEAETRLGNEST
ncbi:unnamed protein product [Clonostachys solani]|uniref:Nuclear pore complex protein Nup85 n=1 Tax=Clonostachys solani TaxID=160281 RepID=A0A9N9Z071_9HYPO|nr:unnamed protein product [Clonostachys solani]